MMQHCDLHGCEIDRRGCPWCLIESLEQQLAAARRAGWERAKREAEVVVRRYETKCQLEDLRIIDRCGNAIAALEYKEPTNV